MVLCKKIFDNLDIYQSCFFNVLKRLKEKQKKKKEYSGYTKGKDGFILE